MRVRVGIQVRVGVRVARGYRRKPRTPQTWCSVPVEASERKDKDERHAGRG